MADNNDPIYSENDALDINELASLNEDISNDFIEQLQSKVSKNAKGFANGDDSQLFEEVQNPAMPATNKTVDENPPKPEQQSKKVATLNDDIDDNFIKKYKAKLQKQQNANNANEEADTAERQKQTQEKVEKEPPIKEQEITSVDATQNNTPESDIKNIEEVSGGNIIEKPLSKETISYKDSLDYLDGNTKYSKYVIYIDPENKEFIDSLTVKERKNLINRIIREQDDVAVTKKRLSKMQTIITHVIVAILTITLFIPIIYWTINASLEATINNYRSSQSMFQTLYKEHGKIKTK